MPEGSGRAYHEKIVFQCNALQYLRNGSRLTDMQWKKLHPGSRLAPVIDKLRNGHGFTIEGNGSVDAPYYMPDVREFPQLVAVTDLMKDAYYETEHWAALRERRKELDGYRCVICCDPEELAVHHICYSLFEEHVNDLMTVCKYHHDKIHTSSRLKFPSGMTVPHASRLGVSWEFAEWLLPLPAPKQRDFAW